jgi:hypothetical protein
VAKFSNKENRITIRLTNVMHSQLTTYAKAYNMTLTKAVEQLLDEGLKAKNNQLVTKSDIELVLSETMRIKEQQQRLSEQNETTRVALVQAIQNQPIAAMQPPKHKILRFLN